MSRMKISPILRASFVALATFALLPISSAQAQTLTTLHNFTGGSDGGQPEARLIDDVSGLLYGTTEGGGTSGDCTVF